MVAVLSIREVTLLLRIARTSIFEAVLGDLAQEPNWKRITSR